MRRLAVLLAIGCLVACGDDDGAMNNNNVAPDAGGICGDGVPDPGEACDDGASNSDTIPDACRTDCRLPWCGDEVVDSDEQCDDGADNSDTTPDACRTGCLMPSCGDGVVDAGEECEGDNGGTTCGDMGLDGGDQVVCDAACVLDPSGCAGCGNTICDTGDGEAPDNCAVDCGPRQVAAGGDFTCTLLGTGQVYCFGGNEYGQLGGTVGTHSTLPVQVVGLTNAVAIAAGRLHACAIREDHTVWCWGSNSLGQLGDGTTTDSATPVAVASLSATALGVTAGGGHTCALLGDDTAACWGRNDRGQLGSGSTADSANPVAVTNLAGLAEVSAGSLHTCAIQKGVGITNGPDVYCWGDNERLQLGISTPVFHYKSTPQQVAQLSFLAFGCRMAAGAYHSCGAWGFALGTVNAYCWGDNTTGALGDGTTDSGLYEGDAVPGLEGVFGITTGGYRTTVGIGTYTYHGHSCARLDTGAVRCWGDNERGQVGDGSTTDRLIPSDVSGLLNVVAVSAGSQHTCALLSDNTLQCWGANGVGQLGTGDDLDRSTPQPVDPSQW